MGCDKDASGKHKYFNLFQSTQPEWAATNYPKLLDYFNVISIHAARMGCDKEWLAGLAINIISIHAARMGCDSLFVKVISSISGISIHAARMGCDMTNMQFPHCKV